MTPSLADSSPKKLIHVDFEILPEASGDCKNQVESGEIATAADTCDTVSSLELIIARLRNQLRRRDSELAEVQRRLADAERAAEHEHPCRGAGDREGHIVEARGDFCCVQKNGVSAHEQHD